MGCEFLMLSSVVIYEIVRDFEYGAEALCVITDNCTQLYSGKLRSARAWVDKGMSISLVLERIPRLMWLAIVSLNV